MKLFTYLMPIIVAMGFVTASPLAARGHGGHGGNEDRDNLSEEHLEGHHHEDGEEHGHFSGIGQGRSRYLEELNERDWDALRDYVNLKRTDEKEDDKEGCELIISGDVRTEWRYMNEKAINQNGHYRILRGGHAKKDKIPVSRNDFDIECNIRFDYICENTWAVAHLDFDNSAGVDGNGHGKCDPEGYHGSGNCNSTCLKKAYFGANVYKCHDAKLDVELGRRNLYNVFDSRIEFLSRFDGITFKYSDKIKGVTNWYWNTAGFLIDERVNQFGWVTEVGFLDICDSGFDLKYSLIDWIKNGKNRYRVRNPRGFDFLVSQFTVAYHLDKKTLGAPAKLYGAILKNHSGVRIRLPKSNVVKCVDDLVDFNKAYYPSIKGQPWGWYVGFTIGEVVKEGDYAFSVQYEWVGATAMPDEDASGIGNGNVLNYSLTQNGRGNTNYKGVMFEFLYALTDNLSIDTIIEVSREIKRSIGGRHHYSKFELEAIYAF